MTHVYGQGGTPGHLMNLLLLSPRLVRHCHISGRIRAKKIIGGNFVFIYRTENIFVRPLRGNVSPDEGGTRYRTCPTP